MIAPAATPREQIAKALGQAGDAGLKVDELVTVTQLSNYVVLYTLRNMKDAGQVTIGEGGEKYQRDRLWVLVRHFEQKPLGRPVVDPARGFDASNRKLIESLTAKHPRAATRTTP